MTVTDSMALTDDVGTLHGKDLAIPTQELIGPIFRKSLFWRAKFLAESPFLAHLPFAFWLVETARPRTVVALGLSQGVAYFSFCQAIEKFDLPCTIFGFERAEMDTAKIQEIERLQAYNQEHYPDLSTLAYGSPLEEAKRFKPGSIDLLYIDQPLDETNAEILTKAWLPLLSDHGLILVNDTDQAPRDDKGRQFLQELEAKNDTIRFDHGGGLLLALTGPAQVDRIRTLAKIGTNQPGHVELRMVFSRLGAAHQTEWKSRTLGTKFEKTSKDLRQFQKQFAETQSELTAKSKTLTDVQAHYDLRNSLVSDLQVQVFDLQTALQNEKQARQDAENKSHADDLAKLRQLELQNLRQTNEISILTQAMEHAREEQAREEQKHQATQQEVKSLHQECEDLRKQVSVLEKAKKEDDAAFQKALKEASLSSTQSAQANELQLQLTERYAEIAALTKALDAAHIELSRIADLEADIEKLTTEMDARTENMSAITADLSNTSETASNRANITLALSAARGRMASALSRGWLSPQGRAIRSHAETLRKSPLFDAHWYLNTYPDVAAFKNGPYIHYLTNGTFEGRDPGPRFSTMDYYLANQDIVGKGMCALLHYERHGRAEGRCLSPSEQETAEPVQAAPDESPASE